MGARITACPSASGFASADRGDGLRIHVQGDQRLERGGTVGVGTDRGCLGVRVLALGDRLVCIQEAIVGRDLIGRRGGDQCLAIGADRGGEVG